VGYCLIAQNTCKVIPLDQFELAKFFYYDTTSKTGLRWKITISDKKKQGDAAGYICKKLAILCRKT